MMGSPQPFKMLEQKIPSLQPRTRSAIKIQRVVLPCEKQFIKRPPVFHRRDYVLCCVGLRFCLSITSYSSYSKKVRLIFLGNEYIFLPKAKKCVIIKLCKHPSGGYAFAIRPILSGLVNRMSAGILKKNSMEEILWRKNLIFRRKT